MTSLSSIQLTKLFKVTKLVFTGLELPNYQYVIGNRAFAISLPDFQILPSSFQLSEFEASYALYWLQKNETRLVQPLDMSSLAPLPEFIKFYSDPGLFNLTLQTDDVENEG